MTPRVPVLKERASGVLLHPTSLPGPFGIGDLGPACCRWIDDLAAAGQSWWQTLPLGPTGYGDSPYQSSSSFAGNINLISPERLVESGLLKKSDLPAPIPPGRSDSKLAGPLKERLLRKSLANLPKQPALAQRFQEYCHDQAYWLDDYALFLALKVETKGRNWLEWPESIVHRERAALQDARARLQTEITFTQFGQFVFDEQWHALRGYAHQRGVKIIGDVPIFVAGDSADVWGAPQFFALDDRFRPAFVAGVPPDYFCATGQLWGNPVYDWAALRAVKYAWWVARLRKTIERVDLVRLDHFRGLEAYWSIPAGHPTAERGEWVKAPGQELLSAFTRALGELPLIAEDLGVITSEVHALRHEFKLPGMCVLQFAFGGAQEDRFFSHNIEFNTVVYTGTHDNDTTIGWYQHELTDAERELFWRYAASADRDPAMTLVRLAWGSPGLLAIAPLQDVLSLDSSARMNRPGVAEGNWSWRLPEFDRAYQERLAFLGELTETYRRNPRVKR